MQSLTVNLARRSYVVYIGSDLLHQDDLLLQHVSSSQVMIVSQKPIAKYYLGLIQNTFSRLQCDAVIIPDGEQNKSLASWQQILESLLKNNYYRSATLIALGGGVVGDVAGFAAAVYQRGVNFIQVPTTLLAQVDASVGGKTAVNHPLGKNMIGAFHQPQAVVIDVNTLETLPDREFRAGISEIIKTALLADEAFFVWLEKNLALLLSKHKEILIEAIKRAVQIKSKIVEADETEKIGRRALLNLGHTFAHAIESCTHYAEYLHGEAVAIGLSLAAALSEKRGSISQKDVERIRQLFISAGLPTELPASVTNDQLIAAMSLDKKITQKGFVFILLSALGEAKIVEDVSEAELNKLLINYRR